MNCQICCCGAEVGYRHRTDCPYPLYRCTEKQYEQWIKAKSCVVVTIYEKLHGEGYNNEGTATV